MGKRPVDCICRNCGLKNTKQCSDLCDRYIQTQSLMDNSNLPQNYRVPLKLIITEKNKVDTDAYKRLAEIKKDINDFVANGKNLYLCSTNFGNAKTSWAVKLLLNYFYKNWYRSYGQTKGIYVSVPKFIDDIKKFNNPPAYIQHIAEADIVIWDDIGCGAYATDYQRQQLLMFIEDRMSAGKCNIYTSNITNIFNLSENLGGRLASRVFNASEVIEFHGTDFRGI